MGQNENSIGGRSRAGRVLGILLLSMLILALGIGAGMMIRPRAASIDNNSRDAGSNDAPLPAGAVLIVGGCLIAARGKPLPPEIELAA